MVPRLVLVGLLSAMAAGCMTAGVYRPARYELAALAAATDVGYPVVHDTPEGVMIIGGETRSVTSQGREYMASLRVATFRRPRPSGATADLAIEIPVLWVPRVARLEQPAPSFRALFVTPRVMVRFPARSPAQLFIGAGGGVAWYRERRDDGVISARHATANIALGLKGLVTPHIGWRCEVSVYGAPTNEPLWRGRGSQSWAAFALGLNAAF